MTIKELIDSRHPFGVPVQESKVMAGMKKAFWDGRQLFLSPAMYSLMRGDDFDSVAKVAVIHIPLPTMMAVS